MVVALVLALAIAGVAALLFRRAAQQRAVAENHTVTEAVRRVAKLSTVEVSLSNWQMRRDAKDLFGLLPIRCEKTLAVFYRGRVAAGFDLSPARAVDVSIERSGGQRRVRVRLPPAKLLYTDVPAPEVVVADGSVCNRVTADDYTRMHNEARAAIEREALQAGVLAKAHAHARDLLAEVVRPLGYELELIGDDQPPAAALHAR